MSNTEDRILAAATKLFLGGRANKVSVDAIAQLAAVSKVTLYKYFKDRETLCLELGRRMLQGTAAKLEGAGASGAGLTEKLHCFLGIISDFIASGRLDLCAELAVCSEGVEEEYKAYAKVYKKALLALIDEGVRAGLLKGGLDRDMAFHYIDMGVEYFRHSPEYRGRMMSDEGFQRRFMQFHVGNIFADSKQILAEPRRE